MTRFLLSSVRCLSRSLTALQVSLKANMPFYAVARGHTPGIYETWGECQKEVANYKCARFKKFATRTEAEEFVQENSLTAPVVDRRSDAEKGAEKKPKEASSEAAAKRKHDDDEEEEENGTSDTKKQNTGDDKTKFSKDSDGYLIVYTDGACQFNGKNGAQAGVGVFFGLDHPLNVSEPVKGRATNNTAEIQAATYALELTSASGFTKVAVHTDSQFMINCMTSWMKGWKKKNWVKSDGEPVKNKEDLITLDKASEGLAVKWIHVKGHAGHEGNEEADRLARKGAKLYKAPPEEKAADSD